MLDDHYGSWSCEAGWPFVICIPSIGNLDKGPACYRICVYIDTLFNQRSSYLVRVD